MSPAAIVTASQPLILHIGPILQKMSDHEFFAFCQSNPEWRLERTREGDLIVMPPTGGWTGTRNFILIGLFSQWVEADGTGLGFDSSTGFTLPNGAKRSPDVAWVKRSRWEALTAEEQEEFPPLCPDFVVELRSRSDDLGALQTKMQEYRGEWGAARLAHRSTREKGLHLPPACRGRLPRKSFDNFRRTTTPWVYAQCPTSLVVNACHY